MSEPRTLLAFALSGGGARGALQAGALQALIEAGYRPDLIVGTSVGALNGAYLAIHGVDAPATTALCQAWRQLAHTDLLSGKPVWLAARALLNRPDPRYREHLRDFFIQHGVTPDLHFGQLPHCRFIAVATDLNSGVPILFGLSSYDNLLDGLLASTAIPPWIPPISQADYLLSDGGFASNLPIEPALQLGATEIIAIDISDSRTLPVEGQGLVSLVLKMAGAVALRQKYLEMALATAKGVSVRHLTLQSDALVPLWDFSHTAEQVESGYDLTRDEIARWRQGPSLPSSTWRQRWRERLHHLVRGNKS